ncbi:MAG: DUF2939 domain-containing protein [Myxococcota bacterium]
MKSGIVGIVVVACLAAAYFWFSPVVALSGFRTAIEEEDAAGLEDRVDFPAVRTSLKAEFNAQILAGSPKGVAENPLGAFAIGLASKVVDGIVDASVTPAGLAQLARGHSKTPSTAGGRHEGRGRRGETSSTTEEEQGELFADARMDRETLSRFSVWVPNDDDEELRFVFRRRGISWWLTAIELPRDPEA